MNNENRRASLGRSAASGALVTLMGQIGKICLQIVGVVVLSRLLAPGDFGVLAMVLAIVTVGQSLRDFGLSNAAIQAKDITPDQQSNLFWLNTGLGFLLAAGLWLGAPIIAGFYDEPIVVDISRALAIVFLLNGIMTQSRAQLARELKFGKLMVADLVPAALGLGAAVSVAAAGFGLWALVLQQVLVAAVEMLLSVLFARWLPGPPRRVPGMGSFLRYGAFLTLSQLVAMVSRNADVVVLGYRAGATPTGYYSRAFELVINPLNQINAPSSKVAVPVLSRLQDDAARFDKFLLTGQKVMLLALVPLLTLLAVIATPTVEIVLGEAWEPAGAIMSVLALAGIFRVASYASYWIALSRGATDVSLWVNLTSAPLLLLCVLFGANWGAIGVAYGFLLGTALTWLVSLIWYTRAANAPGLRMFASSVVVFSANLAPGILSWFILSALVADAQAWLRVLLGVLIYSGLWVAQFAVVPLFRRDLSAVRDIVRLMRSPK